MVSGYLSCASGYFSALRHLQNGILDVGLCKKVSAAFGGEIFFGKRHLFRNYLPGVSAASPRRIFLVCVHFVRAFARTK